MIHPDNFIVVQESKCFVVDGNFQIINQPKLEHAVDGKPVFFDTMLVSRLNAHRTPTWLQIKLNKLRYFLDQLTFPDCFRHDFNWLRKNLARDNQNNPNYGPAMWMLEDIMI